MKNVLPFYYNFVQAVRLKICNFATERCKPFKSTSKNPNEKAKRKNCSPPSSTQARRFIPRPLPRPSTEDGRGRSWSRRSKRPAKRAASMRLSSRSGVSSGGARPGQENFERVQHPVFESRKNELPRLPCLKVSRKKHCFSLKAVYYFIFLSISSWNGLIWTRSYKENSIIKLR